MKKRKLVLSVLCALAIAVAGCGGDDAAKGGAAKADGGKAATGDWKPSGAISIVVPAGAGGDTDLSARVFAKYAKAKTGFDRNRARMSGVRTHRCSTVTR